MPMQLSKDDSFLRRRMTMWVSNPRLLFWIPRQSQCDIWQQPLCFYGLTSWHVVNRQNTLMIPKHCILNLSGIQNLFGLFVLFFWGRMWMMPFYWLELCFWSDVRNPSFITSNNVIQKLTAILIIMTQKVNASPIHLFLCSSDNIWGTHLHLAQIFL